MICASARGKNSRHELLEIQSALRGVGTAIGPSEGVPWRGAVRIPDFRGTRSNSIAARTLGIHKALETWASPLVAAGYLCAVCCGGIAVMRAVNARMLRGQGRGVGGGAIGRGFRRECSRSGCRSFCSRLRGYIRGWDRGGDGGLSFLAWTETAMVGVIMASRAVGVGIGKTVTEIAHAVFEGIAIIKEVRLSSRCPKARAAGCGRVRAGDLLLPARSRQGRARPA